LIQSNSFFNPAIQGIFPFTKKTLPKNFKPAKSFFCAISTVYPGWVSVYYS